MAAALLAGCAKPEEKAASVAPHDFSVGSDTNGNPVVSLNATAQKRIGVESAPVAAAELPAQITAFGTVIDPAPLVALRGELASDKAALDAAQKVAQRARTLFAQEENVSQKSVEAAEADARAAQIKYDSARQTMRMNWGEAIAGLTPEHLDDLIDSLAARQVELARVDLPAGQTLEHLPARATISAVEHGRVTGATPLSFAGNVDPKTLGLGILLRVEAPDPLLAPGSAVEAQFPLDAPPTRGALLPDAATLQFQGRNWVYAQSGETNFTRVEVTLDGRMVDGWFSTNAPRAGEKIVVVGAAILLSEEQKSETAAGAD